jgi:hypothetical protein
MRVPAQASNPTNINRDFVCPTVFLLGRAELVAELNVASEKLTAAR